MPISGVNKNRSEVTKVVKIKIEAVHSHFITELECLVLPAISEQLPTSRIDTKNRIVPRYVQLADPDFNQPGDIDLLIGAELYWKLLIRAPKNKIEGQPALQNTKIGWILGGILHSSEDNADNNVRTCFIVTNGQLQQQLERFWKTESLSTETYYTVEEKTCEKHFAETTYRQKDGRFVVRLSLRTNIPLGGSREQALKRLEALERRLQRDAQLKEAYCMFLDEYEQKGHMSRISSIDVAQAKEVFFIPHQAVIRPDSITTKVRVVFDASAKTSTEHSLNEKLLSGSNLQKDLFKILLRFRTYQYVLTADIAQMYR